MVCCYVINSSESGMNSLVVPVAPPVEAVRRNKDSEVQAVAKVETLAEAEDRLNEVGNHSGFVARNRSAMKNGQYSLPRTSLNPTSRIILR